MLAAQVDISDEEQNRGVCMLRILSRLRQKNVVFIECPQY
jgi:hypothetical protein